MKYLKVTPIKIEQGNLYLTSEYQMSGIYLVSDPKKKSKDYTPLNDTMVVVNKAANIVNFLADVNFLKSASEDVNIWEEPEKTTTAKKETPLEAMQKMKLEPMIITPSPKETVSTDVLLDILSIALHNNKAK